MRKFSTFLPLLFCVTLFETYAQMQENTVFNTAQLTKVAVDDGNFFWTGTARGVTRFDKVTKEPTFYNSIVNEGNNGIELITASPTGEIWFGTNNGVAQFKDGAWQKWEFTDKNNYPANTITSICFDSSGGTWIVAGKDRYYPNYLQNKDVTRIVNHFNGSEWETFTMSDLGEDFRILNIMTAPDGAVWATGSNYAANKGIVLRWKNGIMIKYSSDKDNIPNAVPGFPPITGLAADEQGNIWVSNGWRVARFDGSTWTLYKRDKWGLDTLQSGGEIIRTDSKGNIWLAGGLGMSKWQNNRWKYYPLHQYQYINRKQIVEMVIDANDSIWCLTDAGLIRLIGEKFINVQPPLGFYKYEVRSLTLSSSGELMLCGSGNISGDKGMAIYKNGIWEVYRNYKEPIIIDNVSVDKKGDMWGTGTRGITRFDGEKWDYWGITTGISDTAYSMVADRENTMWITCPGGVQQFDGTKWTMHKLYDGKFWREDFKSITVDSSNNVWVTGNALDSIGFLVVNAYDTLPDVRGKRVRLYKFVRQTNTWETIDSVPGSRFGGPANHSLLTDKYGTVWLATSPDVWDSVNNRLIHGLYAFRPNGETAVFDLQNHGFSKDYQRGSMGFETDFKGNLWFGYDKAVRLDHTYILGGIARFDGEKWYDEGNDTMDIFGVSGFGVDPSGSVWAYSQMIKNGVKDQTAKVYVKKDNVWSPNTDLTSIRNMAFDKNGTGWFTHYGSGITRLRNAFIVGIQEEIPFTETTPVSLYPNPADDYLNIRASLPAGNISIRVHSLLGETIAEQFQHNGNEAFSLRLPIENLAPGVYFVTLKSNGKSVTRMFVKE